MKRTIWRKWTHPLVGAAICDVCAGRYPMNKLTRNADGFLVCTGPGTLNDARGRTATELDEEIAAAARDVSDFDLAQEMGGYDKGGDV